MVHLRLVGTTAYNCGFHRSVLHLFCCCVLTMVAVSAAFAGSTSVSKAAPYMQSAPTLSTALVTYKGHSGPVIGVAWSPDGKWLASSGNDGTVQVWNAQNGDLRWKTSVARFAFAVVWSPDGTKIAAGGSAGSLAVLNAATGASMAIYLGQGGDIEGIAWSPDSKYFVSGSQDNTANVWDVQAGKALVTYKGHSGAVERVAWSPDGKSIASASYDGTVQTWEAATGKQITIYKGHGGVPVWEVAWSPDGTRIVSGTGSAGAFGPVTANNSAKVWEAATGKTLLTYSGHSGQVYALAWSPDGKGIVSGGDDNSARVWSAATGQTELVYSGHSGIVFKVAWSPDGKYIASASVDGTVQVWSPSAPPPAAATAEPSATPATEPPATLTTEPSVTSSATETTVLPTTPPATATEEMAAAPVATDTPAPQVVPIGMPRTGAPSRESLPLGVLLTIVALISVGGLLRLSAGRKWTR